MKNNETRRADGAVQERNREAADRSGALNSGARSEETVVSSQWPAVSRQKPNAGEALAAAAKLLPKPSTTIITVAAESAETENEEITSLRGLVERLEAYNRKLKNRLHYYRDKAISQPLREVDRISHLRRLLTGGIPTGCLEQPTIGILAEQLYEAKPAGIIKSIRA